MASSDPNKHGRIHKALSSLSGSALVGVVTNFLQSVSTSGWADAAAVLNPVTAGAVLATTAIFGISHACEGKAERKKAGALAMEFQKLSNQQGMALDLLNKIADGKIGVTLDWFTQEELAERTAAMISGKMDELLASILESRQEAVPTLTKHLAELCEKLDQTASENVSASGTGATAIGGNLVIEKADTVIIGSPGATPREPEGAQNTGRLRVELDGEFGGFGDAERRVLQFGLAAFLGLEPSAVRIVSVEPGSVRVTLEIPAESVPLLLAGFRHGKLAEWVKPIVISNLSELQTTMWRPVAASVGRDQEIVTSLAARVSVSIAHLPNTGPHLFGRKAMLKQLNDAWTDNQTNVFALVASGGVGKSALVNHWLAGMGRDDYRGARRVYGHSFYSQGTSDGTASADAFFADALAWFGDPDPTKGTAWARGERLAELVRKERTLLILDGMEPLQFPPGPNAGRVNDPGLQALLRELAAQNPGLCVVTTRVHVADLDRFEGKGATQQDLDNLPKEAGAHLLKELGVDGSLEERAKASEEFGNHALALTLLGTYLVKACGGDIRRRTEISLVDADKMHGAHARKVMASYEKWFTKHGREVELSILRMLGLFNRPAEAGCITALRGGEPIADLTAGLADISEADWNIALSNLREAGLLTKEDEENRGTLDAHPLVREHFAERLEYDHPEAWQAGHERLYEFLKGPGCEKELPDTLEEMAPLYAAVLHGCAAGRHQEAYDEVYRRRIQRGGDFYNLKKLGAFGADLSVLASAFEERWRRPVASLSGAAQTFFLSQAGFVLRALGRLTDAVEPMLAGLEGAMVEEDWTSAAMSNGNISELHLTLGRIPEAIDFAEQSVEFADRSGEWGQQMTKRTALADAHREAGWASEAQALFEEAEGIQKDHQPGYQLLYSVQGYGYCDLLLGQGDHRAVIARAEQTLEWAQRGGQGALLSVALDHLSLGRAHLLTARAGGTNAYGQAGRYIDQAVDGLLEAGQLQELPRGLLARAELSLLTGDHADARADLHEAMDIATRDPGGHMKLFVTDCHLGYARLALAEKKPDVARDALAQARALIEETGYHRRDAELAELTEAVGGPDDPGT